TAAFAAQHNIPCTLILAKPKINHQINFNGNFFLYHLLDSEIIWTEVDKVSTTIDRIMEDLKNKGYNPYFIPGGGHGNIGTYAYIKAYEEIERQKKQLNINFDYIFLASGTGTTQAGLIVGQKFNENSEKIIGISVARNEERGKEVIYDSIIQYLKDNNMSVDIEKNDINFLDNYIGKGYGDIYNDILETIKTIVKNEGILLDPIYTGKGFYGMLDYIESENINNKNILFI